VELVDGDSRDPPAIVDGAALAKRRYVVQQVGRGGILTIGHASITVDPTVIAYSGVVMFVLICFLFEVF
jgi:hypothetical protein